MSETNQPPIVSEAEVRLAEMQRAFGNVSVKASRTGGQVTARATIHFSNVSSTQQENSARVVENTIKGHNASDRAIIGLYDKISNMITTPNVTVFTDASGSKVVDMNAGQMNNQPQGMVVR